MPRILFISPFILPTGVTSESTVNAKLVVAGLRAGWEVDIIGEDRGRIPWYPDDIPLHNELAGITSLISVSRVPSMRHFLLRMESQVLCRGILSLYGNAWVSLAIRKGLELVRSKKYDFIMSRALPEYAHLPALILSRKTGVPWIANWNDPAPLRLLPPPYGDGPFGRPPGGRIMSSLRHQSLQRFFSTVSGEAIWHTFPCERLRKYMRNILGNEMFDKSSIVPHIAMESKRQNCVSLPVFSLCYAGSMLKRSPKVFLEGVRRFIDSNHPKERISVLFLGEHFDAVRESALTLGLDGLVQIEKGVAYKDAMKRIEMCTVALLIEAQMQEGIFLPSKIIDYIQVGRPVLAISPLDGTISDLIRKYGGGVVADCFSPESVANAIGLLYSSWRKGTLDHEYGSWRLLSQFSSGHVIGLYNQLFHLVLQRKHV